MINVYVEKQTPRLEYAFELVFNIILKTNVVFFTSMDLFAEAEGVKINYSHMTIPRCLHLAPHGLLFENSIEKLRPKKTQWEELPAIFPVPDSFLPFDIFTASFFLVSRYEEYFGDKRDNHGRFNPYAGIAAQYGFLEKPLVNQWALKMASVIRQNGFEFFKVKKTPFQYIPTFDIDNAWAFRNKTLCRLFLSSAKDVIHGRWHHLKKRFRVCLGLDPDPFDSYDFMLGELAKYDFNARFFFLLRCKGKYDRSIPPHNKKFRKLISRLSTKGKIGIHPSYYSNGDINALQKEISILQEIIGKKITCSRQHFLKLSFPETYRNLLMYQIEEDFSMGYPDCVGFRASVATPFWFFDVESNQKTKLKVVPFQVMDVTLKNYMKLDLSQSLKKIELLMNETAEVGGTFVSLWHNESLGECENENHRRFIYSEMSRLAAQMLKQEKV